MLPLDVKGVIAEFNVGPLVAENFPSPTQNAFGGPAAGVATQLELDPVAVHTVTGRDLQEVPEAYRNTEVIQLYTEVRLFVADGGRSASVVNYRDRRFKAVKVHDLELQGEVFIIHAALEDVQAVA